CTLSAMRIRNILSLVFVVTLSACAGVKPDSAPLVLRPASFDDLPGWNSDRQAEALAAFARSCGHIQAQPPGAPFGSDPAMGTYGQWQAPCRMVSQAQDAKSF